MRCKRGSNCTERAFKCRILHPFVPLGNSPVSPVRTSGGGGKHRCFRLISVELHTGVSLFAGPDLPGLLVSQV